MTPSDDFLSPKDALRYITSVDLKFGDDEQIKCLALLRKAESLIGTDRPDQIGTCDVCGAACKMCEAMPTEYGRDEVYKMSKMMIDARSPAAQ